MSVTTETLRIINEVVYKGKGEAQKLDSDLKKTDDAQKKAKISMGQLATAAGAASAAFGVVAIGAKKFYDTLKAGADIQAAKFTFDNLTASIGTTSDAMLNQLQTSTKGMVSDLELMAFANQTVAMGLGSTTEEVGALAELGSVLGAAFRGDAVAGMEEFNLLLANQSIPRLDTFGISAGAVRSRIAELQAEFPGMSREAAFTQAVLEEGTKTLDKLGDSSEIAASSFGTFEAALKNARDEILLELVEAFGDDLPGAVETATDAIGRFSDAIDSGKIRKFYDLLVLGNRVARAFATAGLSELSAGLENVDDEISSNQLPVYVRHLEAVGVAIEAPMTGMVNWNAVIEETEEEMRRLPPVMIGYRNSMTRMGDAHDQTEAAVRDNTEAVEENTDALDPAIEAARLHAEALDAQRQAARAAGAAMGNLFAQALEGDLFEKAWVSTSAGTAALASTSADAAFEVLVLEERASSLRKEMDKLAGSVAAGTANAGEAGAEYQRLQGELDGVNGRIGDLTTATGGAGFVTFDFAGALFDSAEAADANALKLGGLGVALGLFDEDAAESALKSALLKASIDEIGRAFAAGEIDVYEARDALTAAVEEIDSLDYTIDTATGSMREDFKPAVDEVKAAFQEATGAVEATIDSIDRIPREVTVDVNVNYSQNVPGGGGGLSGPGFQSASGNVFPHGGYSMVGEYGPEFVRLPAGAQVISTNRTAQTISNSTTINGASRRGEQVLLQHLRRLSRPATMKG